MRGGGDEGRGREGERRRRGTVVGREGERPVAAEVRGQ